MKFLSALLGKPLGDALTEFYTAKIHLSPATRQSYKKTLDSMAVAIGRTRSVKRITLADLLEYAAVHLYREELSHNTTRRRLKEVKSFFNWLVKVGYIDKSPADFLEFPRRPYRDNQDMPVPYDHFRQMADAYYHSRWRQDKCRYAILCFMWDTGVRIGGVATLTLSNLDIKNRTAVVFHKGDKEDRVFFGEETAQALAEWLLRRGQRNHSFVFCHRADPTRPIISASLFCVSVGSLACQTIPAIVSAMVWHSGCKTSK